MSKLYRVNFDTEVGAYKSWAVDIEANNAKEARAKAEKMWYESSKFHMFHIKVRVLKPEEEFMYHYFKMLEWYPKSRRWN